MRGRKAALGSFSDRGETRVGQEKIAQALTILVDRAANRIVESLGEFLERSGGQAGRAGYPELLVGVLRMGRRSKKEGNEGERKRKAAHREIFSARNSVQLLFVGGKEIRGPAI